MRLSVALHPLDSRLGDLVQRLLQSDFDRIVCAVAYAKVGAISRLLDDFASHRGKIEAFCSKDSGITSAQAVQLLSAREEALH